MNQKPRNLQSNLAVGIQQQKKSTKFPDAPMFDDGKFIPFEIWRRVVENKLLLNEDHYPTEQHRMAYVENRTRGKAAAYLNPRRKINALKLYRSAQEMLNNLKAVFHDPYQWLIAQRDYRDLKMKPSDALNNFFVELSRLALSDREESPRKDDLYEKLPYLLEEEVMFAVWNNDVSLSEFVNICRRGTFGVGYLQNRKTYTGTKQITTQKTNQSTAKSTNSTNQDSTRLTADKRIELRREGKCFYCREAGHIGKKCPNK